MAGERRSRASSVDGSPKKRGNKLVSEISTVEIKKTTKVSTAPLLKKKASIQKNYPPLLQNQNSPEDIPEEEEETSPRGIPNSETETSLSRKGNNSYGSQNSQTTKMDSNSNNSNNKQQPQPQPQIHPTPLTSQMSSMNQPMANYPPTQMLLQNPSQAQLYNSPGQYSITVNTNDPNAFTTMMMPSVVSRNPVQMRCPYCNENIVTVIKYENNSLVWILTILLFIFCCCCFCIPLLIDDIKDVIHYCPICNREIARIDR